MRPVLFSLFGLNIYGYGTMIAIGIISAFVLLHFRAPKRGYDEDSLLNMTILAIILGVIGGKLVFIITVLGDVVSNPSLIFKNISNGFVFYGAVAAGILGVFIYCRRKKWNLLRTLDLAAPCVSLAQGFGRIGCFLAGCCYGKPTTLPIGVKFLSSSLGPSDTYVLPTEIFSSIFDFLLTIFLLWFDKKERKDGRVFSMYIMLYAVGRFIIEIFRGDPRGNVGFLSTSQFIAIIALVFGLFVYNKDKLKHHDIYDD